MFVCFLLQKQHLFSPGLGVIPYSPESPLPYSPLSSNESGSERDDQIKRGRPPANAIQTLISQGSVVESSIRCQFCNRVFPREKSLQAHMRTHTGLLKNHMSWYYDDLWCYFQMHGLREVTGQLADKPTRGLVNSPKCLI